VAACEPVLLVGETGAGKTTAIQLLSFLSAQPLTILNVHAHTETSDFLGGYRPTRSAERASGGPLFAWSDGPLLSTMRSGELLLVDELSLAEDGVLERLNSVLEPGRAVTLAERAGDAPGSSAGDGAETVSAAEGWRIFATMNPGGDFGKRELSPALRNRFTEVWVGGVEAREDLRLLVAPRLNGHPDKEVLADAVADFWCVACAWCLWFLSVLAQWLGRLCRALSFASASSSTGLRRLEVSSSSLSRSKWLNERDGMGLQARLESAGARWASRRRARHCPPIPLNLSVPSFFPSLRCGEEMPRALPLEDDVLQSRSTQAKM
jgi:AAA domain (dynein-related subfamily)